MSDRPRPIPHPGGPPSRAMCIYKLEVGGSPTRPSRMLIIEASCNATGLSRGRVIHVDGEDVEILDVQPAPEGSVPELLLED